jgi:hypothetical protein
MRASTSGQPSRAQARLKAEGAGSTSISAIGMRRDRVTPTPKHIGSPLARTQTRRPRSASISGTSSSSCGGQGMRWRPSSGTIARCRLPPTTISAPS